MHGVTGELGESRVRMIGKVCINVTCVLTGLSFTKADWLSDFIGRSVYQRLAVSTEGQIRVLENNSSFLGL